MKKFKDFYEAWRYLYKHPSFNDNKDYKYCFQDCLDIEVVKVNPITNSISNNGKFNTKTKIWLECGGYEYDKNIGREILYHDIRLDCGGNTFEKAIIKLANLVKKYYK